jgi:anti-sigma regulatory factor (Ser/Thr protein kinase)
VELLLRETLLNAVIHGSRNDPAERVRCLVKRTAGGVRIWVADSGKGFDWRNWQLGEETPVAASGHGLRILHLYAKRIRFNDRGNRLELLREFHEGEVE